MLFSVSQSTPRSRGGGTPSQVRTGVPPSQFRMGGGYPYLRSGWGIFPIPVQNRGTPPSAGWGYPHPPLAGWGIPPIQVPGQDWGGGLPKLEQHSVYLLRGGRYASCVHAGLFRYQFGFRCSALPAVILLSICIFHQQIGKSSPVSCKKFAPR